jgi:hypothetical protein
MQQMIPVPEDLIQRWEDYRFMHLYEHFQYYIMSMLDQALPSQSPQRLEVLKPSLHVIHALQEQINSKSQDTLDACRKLLQQSPDLVRIFQARKLLLISDPRYRDFKELFRIRVILDLSWDDIQKWICSLRPLETQDWAFFYTLFLSLPELCLEFDSLYPQALASRDLACGFIRLMQQIQNQDVPLAFW